MTLQLPPAEREQVVALKLPVPVEDHAIGSNAIDVWLPDTVTVHVVALPSVNGEAQLADAVVVALLTDDETSMVKVPVLP